MARRRVAVVLALTGLIGAACDGDDAAPASTTAPAVVTTTPAVRPSDGVLTIGVLLPSTGQGANALGIPMSDAIEVAVGDINAAGGVLGNSVRLVEFDEAHAGGFADLIERDADAIIGPASSLVALSELHVAVDAGVVVCSPTATALALDDYPDDGMFFRTAPSDALQMEAIVRQVRDTGEETVGVAHLDDPYGRGLADAFAERVDASAVVTLSERESFSGDQEDLSAVAAAVADQSVIVVLADVDDGGRFLTALDAVIDPDDPPTVIVNDAVREARQSIAQLSESLRSRVIGVAPRALSPEIDGFFAGHAVDCVNLIALAVVSSGSDRPSEFRRDMGVVSYGGSPCSGFAACVERLGQVPQIDYTGLSGPVDLRGQSNELSHADFDVFRFEADGSESPPFPRTILLPP